MGRHVQLSQYDMSDRLAATALHPPTVSVLAPSCEISQASTRLRNIRFVVESCLGHNRLRKSLEDRKTRSPCLSGVF